ncbi:MAG: Ca2+-dependent phosphoinositide-specific phospholipase C, partial [Acholeplasmataceae bacterium]|nr:Ca2+-dependent phosphoinositide-specific phospholipase C [Acholeplasmataceae bacterium]
MIKIVKILMIAILSVVVFFILVVFRLFAIKIYDSNVQNAHMKTLASYYASEEFSPVDESEFINFDINDTTIKLNQIQMLATHNSYKKKGSDIGKFFVGLGDSFEEARALKYGYKNLTDQFESGVRSMEFDLRLRKTQFVLTHVPLVDNSSVAPDFSQALEEIYLFSSNNPNHIPIIILMEIKDDWMILDHALQIIEPKHLENLNGLLKDKLGNNLFTPSDMMETGKTLKETIQTTGWPSVHSLLGKVIFVL